MLRSLFQGEFAEFLRRAMGCFFDCFRVSDDRRRPPVHLVSQPISSNLKEPVVESVARNRCLSSLLLAEGNFGQNGKEKDNSVCKEGKYGVVRSPVRDANSDELKAEAKFLKACGTLPQTPAEIRNTHKLQDSLPHNGHKESSTFHSWLPNTTIEKLILEKQPGKLPSPIKLHEEWESGSDSSPHSPNSCITGQNRDMIYTSCAEGCGVGHTEKDDVHANKAQNTEASFTPQVAGGQCIKRSVCFDCQSDDSSSSSISSLSEVTNQTTKKSGLPAGRSVSKPLPYPTPLKLTDDMQTPGTVFPANLHNKDTGKNARIRSQYVYSVLNPVENFSQLKVLAEKDLSSDRSSAQLKEYIKQADKETPQSLVEIGASAFKKELNVDASLSSWLPPKPTHQGCNDQCPIPGSQVLPDFVSTPGDRPILGMVATHWNADEASFAPKWWDGNGIPNSTNKYKEDQKVRWHATPFEERLEKALSEDSLIAARCYTHDGINRELETTQQGQWTNTPQEIQKPAL